jgi:succinoglycan biosynthesis protein ExoA
VPDPLLSVCIITRGPSRLLEECLVSLRRQVDAPSFEVLVCSNGGPDAATAVHRVLPDAVVGVLDHRPLGSARNAVIERARGDWLVFLDDDVTVQPHLLGRLAELAAEHPDATVLGGPNETPGGSTAFQVTQGAVLASIVTSGPVRRRYGRHPAGGADERYFTLCNLAVRRDAMQPFPDDLLGAEENAVLVQMSRRGFRMHYDPTLVAFHERRPTLRTFARQMFKYGRGRGQFMRKDPASARAAYLAPAALLAYALAAPLLVIELGPLALLPMALYAGVVAAAAAVIGWNLHRSLRCGLLAALLIVVTHVWYGAGTVVGVLDRRRRRRRRRTRPARWSDAPADDVTVASADR